MKRATGPESWRPRLPEALWLAPPLLALLPHLSYLPLWFGAVCLGLMAWRLGLILADRPLPPRAARVLLALGALVAVWLHYGGIVGQRAGVPLFILLLFAKLLETASLGQKRLVLILTQFLAMSYFLTGQSLPVTLYLLALSLLSVAVMAHLQAEGRMALPAALRQAALLFAGGLPLALLLFVFFPRLDHPLWSLPLGPATARIGLSDSLGPGDIAQLIQSSEIAFRVQFADATPNPQGIYWRGLVFADFDGRVWRDRGPERPLQAEATPLGQPWSLALTLEPHQQRWLFSPGLPDPLPAGTRLLEGLQWRAGEVVNQRRRWSFQAYADYRLAATPESLRRALALPAEFNPRARALAETWRQADPRPQALIQRALRHYHAEFFYTLRPPLLGAHSVDDFLFGSRRGFCEHFASSFVFLMRAAGVPARVVTGYLGGEINPLDGHVVVRQSDAHAWAEVWLGPERGWTRVDPTASVSPARVEQGIEAALPAVEIPPALARLSITWLQGLRHTWEMLNNGWNQWVLGYGQAQQLRLLERLSPLLAHARWLAAFTILAGVLGVGMLAWWYWRGLGHAPADRGVQAWRRVEARLARIGLGPRLGEPPGEYVPRIARARPDLGVELQALAGLYTRHRYGGEESLLTELEHRAKSFRPGAKAPGGS